MQSESIASQLRALRRKSGLSQAELANILGFHSTVPVERHERSRAIPHLLTVIAYEVVFQAPIAAQFREMYQSVEIAVEIRLAEMEHRLQECNEKGRDAIKIARKLEFLTMRKEPKSTDALS